MKRLVMTPNTKNGVQASDPDFDRFIHYDSSIADFFPITFPGKKYYIMWVTDLYFETSDASPYEDPTAYLLVETQNSSFPTIGTQINKKMPGHLFPICKPGSSNKCTTYVKGEYSGKEELKFKILDKNLVEIDTNRVVVTLHIVNNQGQVFVV